MTQRDSKASVPLDERAEKFHSVAAGRTLYRTVFRASTDQLPKFAVLMAHGWGDHMGCHRRAAQMFVDRGGMAIGVDWPGNGKSSGIRGHMAGIDQGVEILCETLATLRAELADLGAGQLPLGFYAHSTGCPIGVKFIAGGEASLFKFAWLSSPLARPEAGQSDWKIRAAGWIARLVPKMPFDTGVRLARCHRADPETGAFADDTDCHPLISVGFGHELAMRSKNGEVMGWARSLQDPLRLLMTLGTDDTICPPEYGREFFEAMPLSDKTLIELPGFLHEPLRDGHWRQAVAAVEPWLVDVSG